MAEVDGLLRRVQSDDDVYVPTALLRFEPRMNE